MTERQVAIRSGMGVALVMLVLGLVSGIVGSIWWLTAGSGSPLEGLGALISAVVGLILHAAIVGAGVAVSLAFIRPVAEGSPLRTIVVRGFIAAAVGAAAYLVLNTLYTLVTSLASAGPWFGYAFPSIRSTFTPGYHTLSAFFGGLQEFLSELPLVILVILVVARFWSEATRLLRPGARS
jgi:hypothetical protein